jgi:hypothetical protein
LSNSAAAAAGTSECGNGSASGWVRAVSLSQGRLSGELIQFQCREAHRRSGRGARFNPFPGAPAANIPTIYAADLLEAAALESIFHDVPHVPSPSYPRLRLGEWSYSELKVTRDLVLLELVNPKLRQFRVPSRVESITESELIHTPPSEYPHTRTWAQSFHTALSKLDGLAWRPRLAGTGTSFVFFGDRFKTGDLQIHSSPTPTAIGDGFLEIYALAKRAHITIVIP